MKKLLIYIMIFFSILAHAVEVNECKTDIYYGNGVWNEPEDVEKSKKKLEKYIINKEIINGDPKLKAKYGKVKAQYNWGQGYMLDVLETYYQLKEAGQVQDYQFYAVIAILTKGNPTLTIGAIATQELMEPFTRGWEEGNVNDMWEKYYNESFKLSHKVLLVSHSQGGLFANRIHDVIAPSEYKSYFANLQVASPASEVKAQKGDYVTLSTDLTSFDPVVNFIPDSMRANASGDSGHAFTTAYLGQIDPYTKITIKIKQLLADLDTEPSQWETDQELNKGTKDYKITVKHRYDSSVIMSEEVYPFAPSKKLYHVTDNTGGNGWVKARCGGYLIETTWTGQDIAIEVAKLSHDATTLPHEILKYEPSFTIWSTRSEYRASRHYIAINGTEYDIPNINWGSGSNYDGNGYYSYTFPDGNFDSMQEYLDAIALAPNINLQIASNTFGGSDQWSNATALEILTGQDVIDLINSVRY